MRGHISQGLNLKCGRGWFSLTPWRGWPDHGGGDRISGARGRAGMRERAGGTGGLGTQRRG